MLSCAHTRFAKYVTILQFYPDTPFELFCQLIFLQDIEISTLMSIVHLGANLFFRMTILPGDTNVPTNVIQAFVAACIVYSSDNIWNYACELALFRLLAKPFKRVQTRRITERDYGFKKMKTHNCTITIEDHNRESARKSNTFHGF